MWGGVGYDPPTGKDTMPKPTFLEFLQANAMDKLLTCQQQDLATAMSNQKRLVFLSDSTPYGRALVFRMWAKYVKEGGTCQTKTHNLRKQ